VTVEGNGHRLRRLIAKRRDIFAGLPPIESRETRDHERPLNHPPLALCDSPTRIASGVLYL
jgi:hypothetical protein